jgi:cytochrome c peroxidase
MKARFWKYGQLPIAAVSAAIVLSACGGGGSSDSAPAASNAASGGAAPLASAPVDAVLNLDLANLLNYAPQLPPHYAGTAALDNAPANIVASNAVATLGRVLFYDKRLSVNDTTSCASCHQQGTDFADNKRFSLGFEGNQTPVHSMRLANVRYWQPGNMFWDRRSASLEVQATQPPQNSIEMGFDEAHGGIAAFLSKLASQPYYPELFSLAFGDGTVTEDRVQRALAQFMRGMVSTNSRWDSAYAQVFNAALPDKGLNLPAPGLSAQEDRGRHLFMALPPQGGLACAACHVPPTFALSPTSGSNGLDAGETKVFKSPSLKNVAQSSTFMHDGRFSTLEEVVDHYASGVRDGPALDVKMKGPDGLPRLRTIAAEDKAALVAFLKTLSDPMLAADPRFSDPFRR